MARKWLKYQMGLLAKMLSYVLLSTSNFHEISLISTVWKFQNFSVIQILREINFGESESFEIAIFANFGALNVVNLVNFSLQKVQNLMKIKTHSL